MKELINPAEVGEGLGLEFSSDFISASAAPLLSARLTALTPAVCTSCLNCCSYFHIGLPASVFGPNLFSPQGDPFKVEAKSYSIFSELLDSLLSHNHVSHVYLCMCASACLSHHTYGDQRL